MTSFYLIREREHAKYPRVLHNRLQYYTLSSRVKDTKVIINKGNSVEQKNPLLDGLTDNTCGRFTRCSHFSLPCGARKNITQLVKYPPVLSFKPSKMFFIWLFLNLKGSYLTDTHLVSRTCFRASSGFSHPVCSRIAYYL